MEHNAVKRAPIERGVLAVDLQARRADPAADLDRVRSALAPANCRFDIGALRELPGVLRQHAWRVQARLRGDELIRMVPPRILRA